MTRATFLNLSLGILSKFFRTPLLPGCNVSKSCVMTSCKYEVTKDKGPRPNVRYSVTS